MSTLPPLLRNLLLPVIGSPLFIVSTPATVIAQCKAGVLGTMPTLNARPAAQLDEWLGEIAQTLAAHDRAQPERPAAPFGVNLIVHKSNDRLDADLTAVVRHRVPVVITSLGARTEVNEAIRGYGGVVLRTPDGGRTWVPQESNTEANLFAVSIHKNEMGFAVGSNGAILRYVGKK